MAIDATASVGCNGHGIGIDLLVNDLESAESWLCSGRNGCEDLVWESLDDADSAHDVVESEGDARSVVV